MSRKKDIPVRKCVGTNERRQKAELLRIVRVEDQVIIDQTGELQGRGAYITPDVHAIKKAKKKHAFARALRMKLDEKIYDDLLELVNLVHMKEPMDE
ncbi:MAG: YlxR family protein [Defluviitaleaceae bacterium]|nr:YlxR family protein [Defluviitaleaceae bacterium]